MTVTDLQTKRCPFCAETIQAAAIKCRFCGEFLNSDKARALEADSESNSSNWEEKASERILFWASPSLLGMAGAMAKGLLIIVLVGLMIKLPFENVIAGVLKLHRTQNQVVMISQYKYIICIGLIIAVAAILTIKIIRLKMTHYEVTADRIEWGRGILDRKVDNLDMFRVIDLKMRRTVFDCIFGIGTVVIMTTDKTDPEFVFKKIRNPRKLYDVIKKASLDADRRNRAVHIE